MSLASRLTALVQAIGADIKVLKAKDVALDLVDTTLRWTESVDSWLTNPNFNLANPSIQIPAPPVGTRYLVTGQGNPANDGIYVFNGAGVPMTRPGDAKFTTDFKRGKMIYVAQMDAAVRYTGADDPQIGVATLTFDLAGPSGAFVRELHFMNKSLADNGTLLTDHTSRLTSVQRSIAEPCMRVLTANQALNTFVSTGDLLNKRVLLTGQTNKLENGVYIYISNANFEGLVRVANEVYWPGRLFPVVTQSGLDLDVDWTNPEIWACTETQGGAEGYTFTKAGGSSGVGPLPYTMHGPFDTGVTGQMADNAETTLTVNLPTPVDPTKCTVVGNLYDGYYAHHGSWRAFINSAGTQVSIVFANSGDITTIMQMGLKFWVVEQRPMVAGSVNPAYNTAPIGSTLDWTGKTIPWEYVVSDGRTLTEAAYPQGYAFAKQEADAGNTLWTYNAAAKTFTVPNLSDRFIYSAGAKAFGATGGAETHQLTSNEMPAHSHPQRSKVANGSGTVSQDFSPGNNAYQDVGPATGNTGGNAAHNNMPPYLVLARLIKVRGVTADPTVVQGPQGPAGVASAFAAVTAVGGASINAANPPAAASWAPYAPVAGDRVLLTNGPSPGIWIYNGAGVAMVRAADDLGVDNPRGKTVPVLDNTLSNRVGLYVVYAPGAYFAPLVQPQEAWRQVGAAGQPGFLNNWVQRGGTATAPTEFPLRFFKDQMGFVHVNGVIMNGTADTDVVQLPSGYRSTKNMWIPGSRNGANNTIGGVRVSSTGEIAPTGLAANANIGLHFSFLADS